MNRSDCEALDARDPLASLRQEFTLPEDVIYLDGNSLGPLQRKVIDRIENTVSSEWSKDLIRSWNTNDWIKLPLSTGEKIAPLIGAGPDQVVCTDSTSINHFKLIAAALSLRPDRTVVLSTTDNFPTDLYMVEGLASLIPERCELKLVAPDQLVDTIDESVAAVTLTEVNFRTGERHDMARINEAAHQAGSLTIWDLSHSAGAVPVNLDDCNVDFAFGCGYKFLNGGPGAPAYLYVAKRHQGASQPLSGWMGHARPFEFESTYEPAEGMMRFTSGTPGIIGLSALNAALDIWQQTSVEAVYAKAASLADVLVQRLRTEPLLSDLKLVGPGPRNDGGSQLCLSHPKAYGIVQALIERNVIGDFREPDIVRLGICPLYLSHSDVFEATERLIDVMKSEAYLDPRFSTRAFVT
jgi:kynureninase